MRAVFSLAVLVIVLAVIGLLVKKQLTSVTVPVVAVPGATVPEGAGSAKPPLQQQLKQFSKDINEAVQQAPRRIDDQ